MAGRRTSRVRIRGGVSHGRRMGGLPLQPHEPEGLHVERWRHVHGCGRFFNAVRDTVERPSCDLQARRSAAGSRRACQRAAPMNAAACLTAAGSIAASGCAFSFDGRAYEGFAGDTLASALIANGVHLVGRSFKYHRPRGIVDGRRRRTECAGHCRPRRGAQDAKSARDAGRTLRRPLGRKPEPLALARIRSCRGERPDRAADPGRFLLQDLHVAAGGWSRLYEPASARMAGLGRAPTHADPDRYTRRTRTAT